METTSYTHRHISLPCPHHIIVFWLFLLPSIGHSFQRSRNSSHGNAASVETTLVQIQKNTASFERLYIQPVLKKDTKKSLPGPYMQSCPEDMYARSNIYGMLISKLKLISKLRVQKKPRHNNSKTFGLLNELNCKFIFVTPSCEPSGRQEVRRDSQEELKMKK